MLGTRAIIITTSETCDERQAKQEGRGAAAGGETVKNSKIEEEQVNLKSRRLRRKSARAAPVRKIHKDHLRTKRKKEPTEE